MTRVLNMKDLKNLNELKFKDLPKLEISNERDSPFFEYITKMHKEMEVQRMDISGKFCVGDAANMTSTPPRQSRYDAIGCALEDLLGKVRSLECLAEAMTGPSPPRESPKNAMPATSCESIAGLIAALPDEFQEMSARIEDVIVRLEKSFL